MDVERIARDLDFSVLQDNIEHIALCNIDMEVVSEVRLIPFVIILIFSRTLEQWIRILSNCIKYLN